MELKEIRASKLLTIGHLINKAGSKYRAGNAGNGI